MIDHLGVAKRMETFATALTSLLAGVSADEARRRPASGAWSIVEIVAHLADEECEDFRPRLQSLLKDPSAKWPPIDPERAARDRRYIERDLHTELRRFTGERSASIAWLHGLCSADWSAVYAISPPGPIRADQLLACWAAHDALHLRQVAKRLYELAEQDGSGQSIEYAGKWGA